jgi:hypothetical protein
MMARHPMSISCDHDGPDDEPGPCKSFSDISVRRIERIARRTNPRWRVVHGFGGQGARRLWREPADTDQAAFQGIHALNPLLMIDEARHDDQTDVMTEFGWRRFKDLDGPERLMTMSVRFSDQHQRWRLRRRCSLGWPV